jgi:hypothetical protein
MDALNALRDIAGGHPGRDDAAVLQQLIDDFLDVMPASSTGALEYRLLTLAAALDQLGPWAEDDEVVSHAVRLSRHLH